MQNYPEAKELIVLFPYQFQTDESLYSGSGNGTVHTWNMKTRRISSILAAHPGHSVLWIDFSPSGGELWTHGRDGWVKQWSQSDTGWKETGLNINPFKLNGISHSYQMDQSISVLRLVGKVFFIFIQKLIECSASK